MRHLSSCVRLRVSAVYPCHCSGIWCSAWAVVSCRVTVAWIFCGRGATLVTARETQRLPALRGSNQRAAAPATLFRPPGRPCRKGSQTFSLIPFRILWIASAVGCQSTHARLRSPSRGGQIALSPASAPGARDHCRQPAPCLQKPLEPETTAEQPAPVSTKAPGTRDHCRATGPRVYKSSSSCPTEGNRTSSLEQDSLPETAAGQPAPASTKAVCNSKTGTPGDNQSHSEPALTV